jgi:hypothetical protein
VVIDVEGRRVMVGGSEVRLTLIDLDLLDAVPGPGHLPSVQA